MNDQDNFAGIMTIDIVDLEFSKTFKEQSSKMGFRYLQEIAAVPPEELLKKDDFDYNWLGELVSYLSERQLLYLLQPTPGNIRG